MSNKYKREIFFAENNEKKRTVAIQEKRTVTKANETWVILKSKNKTVKK